MRTFLLGVLCCCVLSSSAAAKELTFGQKPNLFSLHVDDSWIEEMLPNGVHLTSHDHKQSLVIAVNDSEGLTLDALQRPIPARLELKDVKKKEGKGRVTITGTRDNLPLLVQLVQRESIFISVVSTGMEKKGVDALLDSLNAVVVKEEEKNEIKTHEDD
ncbi:MAG: hypothetical protein IKN64_10230 [Desulfovibrio sp.]|nr:hypothetical protein [Desulfovibrio sp.]